MGKKNLYISILVIFLNSSNIWADAIGGMCVINPESLIPAGNLGEITLLMEGVQKEKVVEYATEDMADFCKRNFILRFLNSQKSAPPNCSILSLKELEKIANDKIKSLDKYALDSWDLSLISTENSRNQSVDVFQNNKSVASYGKRLSYNFDTISTISNDRYDIIFKKLKNDLDNSESIISSSNQNMMKTVACAKTALFSLISCKSSLDFVEKTATPRIFKNQNVTNIVFQAKVLTPEAWLYVYKNNRLDNALITLAKELQSKLKSGNIDDTGNIFDDLNSHFIADGLTQEEATEATFQILAIISNGGPNTASRIVGLDLEALPKSSAIAFLSQAMGAIDYLKQKKGFSLYSYPSEIKTKCDYAKPYHFWMSAYLSQELVKNKIATEENAPEFVFLAQKGYQINRDVLSSGAGKTSKVLSAESFGPIKQIIRLDLSFAAAGAIFGAKQFNNLTPIKQIDVDRATVALLKKAQSTKTEIKDSDSFLQKYSAWNEQFAPDEALRALR